MFKIPKIVAIICASVVATAAVAGAGVAIATAINSETPFEKTMKAIAPEIELFEKADEEGAEYDFNIKIDEELFKEQFPASIEVDFNTKVKPGKSPIASAEGTIIIGEREKISILAVSESEKEVQLKCQELLGDTVYSVPLTEKIIEEIDASPFAPSSGSKYAMPEELYEGIKNIISNAENTEEYTEVFDEAFETIEKKWLKTLEIEKDKKEIELYDGKTKATVYTLTLDQNSLIALIDIVLAEWEENKELQSATYSYIEAMEYDYYITDDDYCEITDEEESQTPEEIINDLIENIEETKSEIENVEMDIVINYAEKSGYMVALQVDFEFTDDTEWGKISFDWIFSSNPEKNPGFTMTFSLDDSVEAVALSMEYYCVDNGDDGTTKIFEGKFEASEQPDKSVVFKVTQDIKKDNSYELKASIEENSVEIGAIKLTGEYALEKDSMKIILNKLKITGPDNEVFAEVDEIAVAFSVKVGKQQIELMEDTKSVFALKEEDIDKLLEDVEDNFNEFIEDIMKSFYEGAIQDAVTT